MADQPDVFASQPQAAPAAQEPTPQPSDSAYAHLLSQIKNEQGQPKYDSLPKALEGLANAQQYIPQLKTELQSKEAELAELRAKLAQQAQLEEVVSRLTANQNQPKAQETPSPASGLDEQAVMNLLEQRLVQREQAAVQNQNAQQVHAALTAKFGEKANEVVAAKARELGTTPEELGKLASQTPAMVLALFNTSASKGPTPVTTSINIPASHNPGLPELKRPEKSLLIGATSKQQAEYMRQIKERVYAEHGITPN